MNQRKMFQMLASVGLTLAAGSAQGQVIIDNFESGNLSKWTQFGPSLVEAGTYRSIVPDSGSPIPVDTRQALIRLELFQGNGGNLNISDLETQLHFPSGTFDLFGNGDSVDGAALLLNNTLQVDTTSELTFRWNFATSEFDLPSDQSTAFNDFAFFSLRSTSQPSSAPAYSGTLTTVRTMNEKLTPVSSRISEEYFFETQYQTRKLVVAPGTYELAFGVIDVDDDVGLSGLLIDDISITPVPEPWAWSVMTMVGLGGFVGVRRWRRRR